MTVDGSDVSLTAKEFDLLLTFARHPGRVFTRAQLLEQVWGYGHSGYEHTVNSHINRLRAKIGPEPADPRYLLTVWGRGGRSSGSERGGRWFTHTVMWTAAGMAAHDPLPVLMSYDDIMLHQGLGRLEIAPGPPEGGPRPYFECPLLRVR